MLHPPREVQQKCTEPLLAYFDSTKILRVITLEKLHHVNLLCIPKLSSHFSKGKHLSISFKIVQLCKATSLEYVECTMGRLII